MDMNRLRMMRLTNHYTIEDMGKMLCISASYYWQIENKKRSLYYHHAKAIASIFKMKPDDLFYDEY